MMKMEKQPKEALPLFLLPNRSSRGVTIVELLAAIAISTIVFVGIVGGAMFVLQNSKTQEQKSETLFLVQEAIEGLRVLRDTTDWDTDGLGIVTNGISYQLEVSGMPPQWELVPGEETIREFTREIIFEEMRRDASSNIVDSGGTLDEDSK